MGSHHLVLSRSIVTRYEIRLESRVSGCQHQAGVSASGIASWFPAPARCCDRSPSASGRRRLLRTWSAEGQNVTPSHSAHNSAKIGLPESSNIAPLRMAMLEENRYEPPGESVEHGELAANGHLRSKWRKGSAMTAIASARPTARKNGGRSIGFHMAEDG